MVLLGSVSADNVEKTDRQAKKDIHFENSLVYGSQFAAEELPHVRATPAIADVALTATCS
jgi:hypothetical protein